MDAEVLGNFQSLAGTLNVFEYRARQTAWDGALQCLSNRLNAIKVALTRNREACFNDVHAELFERERDLQFLTHGETLRQSLFTVAQRRIEDDDSVVGHFGNSFVLSFEDGGCVVSGRLHILPNVEKHTPQPRYCQGMFKERMNI